MQLVVRLNYQVTDLSMLENLMDPSKSFKVPSLSFWFTKIGQVFIKSKASASPHPIQYLSS